MGWQKLLECTPFHVANNLRLVYACYAFLYCPGIVWKTKLLHQLLTFYQRWLSIVYPTDMLCGLMPATQPHGGLFRSLPYLHGISVWLIEWTSLGLWWCFFHQQKCLYFHHFVLLSKVKEMVCQFHNLVHYGYWCCLFQNNDISLNNLPDIHYHYRLRGLREHHNNQQILLRWCCFVAHAFPDKKPKYLLLPYSVSSQNIFLDQWSIPLCYLDAITVFGEMLQCI